MANKEIVKALEEALNILMEVESRETDPDIGSLIIDASKIIEQLRDRLEDKEE
jgi:hypothetical protein